MRIGGLVGSVCLVLTACSTTHRVPRPDLPESERGATEMRDLLDGFNRAVADERFDVAEEILQELEEGIRNADPALIMHWDYGRISERVGDADRLLATARRDHAIAELSAATEKQLRAGDELLTKLHDEGPSDWRLERLDEICDSLEELSSAGDPFAGEARYVPVRGRLLESVAALGRARRAYAWLFDLGATLRGALAVMTEEPATETAAQIDQVQRALAAFDSCVRTIKEARAAEGQDPSLEVTTPLGRFSVTDTADECAKEHEATAQQLTHLRWRRSLEETAAWVSGSLHAIETQKGAAAVLGANERAVQTLTACEQRLADTESAPGYVSSMSFASHMGKLTAVKLRDKCAEVRDRLVALQPTLRWRAAADDLRGDVQGVRERAAKAKQASAVALAELGRGYERCRERATALAGVTDPVWHDAAPGRRGIKAMEKLAAACAGEQEYVGRLEAKAKAKGKGKGR